MRTIQEIEQIDLNKIDRREAARIKDDLQKSFYWTSSKELTSDGRSLKDAIGEQLTRFQDHLMNGAA